MGKGTLYVNAPFDPVDTYRVLGKYRVTHLTTAPTAYRILRAAGIPAEFIGRFSRRVASSAGEPRLTLM